MVSSTEGLQTRRETNSMNSVQLPDSDIWFVRAERANIIARHFLEQGIVEMGWGIGPIKEEDSINEIIARLAAMYPNEKKKTIETWGREIKEFNKDMEVGDVVATVSTYQPQGRLCHIGIIRDLLIPAEPGPHYAEYDNDHIHRVEWLYQFSKDTLSEHTRRRLDRPLTLHRLSPEASAELRQHCAR